VNLNDCAYSKYELQLYLYRIYFMKMEHDTHMLSQTVSSVDIEHGHRLYHRY